MGRQVQRPNRPAGVRIRKRKQPVRAREAVIDLEAIDDRPGLDRIEIGMRRVRFINDAGAIDSPCDFA